MLNHNNNKTGDLVAVGVVVVHSTTAESTTRAWQFNWAGSEAASKAGNSGQAKWRPNWFLFLPA